MMLSVITYPLLGTLGADRRALFYSCLVVVLGLMSEEYSVYVRNVLSYLSRDDNALNLYMVKMGWAWTLITVCFLLLSNPKLTKHSMFKLIVRWLAATAVWFVWTNAFLVIWQMTGVCDDGSHPELNTIRLCKRASKRWMGGFDVSGHTFLMIWNNLFIVEEAILLNVDFNSLLVLLSVLIVGLWDLMLIATSLFFHSFAEKLAGLAVAVITWAFLYKWAYHKINCIDNNSQKSK